MSKVKAALGVVAVVAAMVVGIVAYRAVGGFFEPKAELTNTVVSRQLETMQDLTTAREFSEGNIAHVNQKKFTMFYSYEIRAGVDLSKAKIAVDNDNHVISITLPKADLQSVSVDPDSLRFFDEQTSLFNDAEVSDTAAALQDAKKTAANKATKSDLLKEADKQAKKVVQNAYAQIAKTDGYKVEVQVADK